MIDRFAHQVDELSEIAAEPEAQRISSYAGGGGPGAIYAQTNKIYCTNLAADPGSIPIFNTYFLHADLGGCPTTGQIRDDTPTFHRRVDEMAQAVDRRPALLLFEKGSPTTPPAAAAAANNSASGSAFPRRGTSRAGAGA